MFQKLYPNFFEIVESSKKTFEETAKELTYYMKMFIPTCDVLFLLCRVANLPLRENQTLMTDNDYFQKLCDYRYVQAPYSLFCLIELWSKGFYTESYMIYRHLFEAFIQMRYYQKHNDKSKLYLIHENDLSNKNTPKNKEFINELLNIGYNESSALYEFYQTSLCSASHGTAIISEIRTKETYLGSGIATLTDCCKYNENHAVIIGNQTVPLMLGYINYFEHFFPNNTLHKNNDSEKTLNNNFIYIKNMLLKSFDYCEKNIHIENKYMIELTQDFKKIIL